jgi:hypothetical protein
MTFFFLAGIFSVPRYLGTPCQKYQQEAKKEPVTAISKPSVSPLSVLELSRSNTVT